MVKTLLLNRLKEDYINNINDGEIISKLTSLVEKYDIYFNVQAKRRSVHVNGYCGTELNFGSDCCIGHPPKILYMQSSNKIYLQNLTASQKHRTEINN